MVAIVAGGGQGLFHSSLSQLNGFGNAGNAQVGQGKDRAYVNVSNGNLVIQSQDDYLVALGLDVAALRTYNSQGLLDDDNGDGWRMWGTQRLLLPPSGGSITRVGSDGYRAVFTDPASTGIWRSTDGAGAHDTLQLVGSNWKYTEGSSGIVETYGSDGRLLNIKDADGNTQTFGYNAQSQLASVTDASGQVTSFEYHAGTNNLKQIRTSSNGLDASDGMGRVTSTEYDDAANRIITVAGKNLRSTQVYNKAGDLLQSTQSTYAGNQTLQVLGYAYDASGRLRMVTDAQGARQFFIYDERGFKTADISAMGEVTEYGYNVSGQVTARTRHFNTLSAVQMATLVDPVSGLPLNRSIADVRPSSSTENRVERRIYDAAGREVFSIDATRAVTETVYDTSGRVLKRTRYAKLADTGLVSEANYAGFFDTWRDPANDRTERYFYDRDGLLVATLDGEGYLVERFYNASRRQLGEQRYAHKILSTSLLATGDLAALREAVTTLAPAPVRAQDQISRNFYDGRGQLIATLDAEGYFSEYSYDRSGGNRTNERRYNGAVSYDPAKAPDAYKAEALANVPPGSALYSRIIYTYDALNRVTQQDEYFYTLNEVTQVEVAHRVVSKTFEYNVQSGLLERAAVGTDAVAGSPERRAIMGDIASICRRAAASPPPGLLLAAALAGKRGPKKGSE